MKLLNIVKIQNKPFDESTYHPEKPIKYMNEHGKEVIKSFNLLNVIRWRYANKEAKEPYTETETVKKLRDSIGYTARYPDKKIETNTKIVEWSDGTSSLVVGDEYFDMIHSKSNNTHVYLKSDDLLVHKHKVENKVIIKPSNISKRAHKAILKNVNDRTKHLNQVEKTFTQGDDPRFRRGKIIEKKAQLEKGFERKRVKRDMNRFLDE